MTTPKPTQTKVIWSDLADEAFQRHFKLASANRSSSLEPEHVLLALVELKTGAVHDLFLKARIASSEIVDLARAALPSGKKVSPLHVGTPSDRWKAFLIVLHAPGTTLIGTADVLLGLVTFWARSEPDSALLGYLYGKGLNAEIIQAAAKSAIEPVERELPDYDTSKMKLLKETRWSRLYEIRPKHSLVESKFQTGEATITLAEIEKLWLVMDLHERLDFISSYQSSLGMRARDEDQLIIEYLIATVDEEERSTLAYLLGYHYKNRAKAFEVLTSWLRDDETCDRTNIVQSLATFDEAAIPIIRECIDQWLLKINLEHFPEKPSWQDRAPYSECATCVGMLYKMTEEAKYKGILERLSQYPDDLIAQNVKKDLEEVSQRH